MPGTDPLSRRSFVQALLAAAPVIRGHGKINPPVLVPDIPVVRQDAVPTTLLSLLKGHATAVHLMFTSCTTTCPIQAATFQRVQESLPHMADRGIQLLSLSVDPEDDTPKEMSAWLHHYQAGPAWLAAAPATAALARMEEFFGKSGDSTDHSTQVHIIDRDGRLVWRTYELPTPGEITGILQKMG
jgi:protein SCO1/2